MQENQVAAEWKQAASMCVAAMGQAAAAAADWRAAVVWFQQTASKVSANGQNAERRQRQRRTMASQKEKVVY
jgi:hypothetical protein